MFVYVSVMFRSLLSILFKMHLCFCIFLLCLAVCSLFYVLWCVLCYVSVIFCSLLSTLCFRSLCMFCFQFVSKFVFY